MSNTILLKRGLSTQWEAANIVLASGEPGFDVTNNILKIGDGSSSWNSLPIINSNIPSFTASTGIFAQLSANDKIKVDTIESFTGRNIVLKPSGLGNPATAYRKVSIEGNALEVGRSGYYDFNIESNSSNSGDINIVNTNGNINLISNSGNIGIGTQEPLSTLHVYSPVSGASLFTVEGSNGVLFSISDNNSDVVLNANNEIGQSVFQVFKDGRLVAGRPDQNDFVITSGGYIGLGTNSPSHKLDVKGIVDASGLNSIYLTSSYINAFSIGAKNINLLPSGQLVCNSGNFNILNVDNVPVSISGHIHKGDDILIESDDYNSTTFYKGSDTTIFLQQLNINGLTEACNSVGGIRSESIYDFNSSVSGLLPVTNIAGSGYINVNSSSGNYIVSVTGLGSAAVANLPLSSTDIQDYGTFAGGQITLGGEPAAVIYNEGGISVDVGGFGTILIADTTAFAIAKPLSFINDTSGTAAATSRTNLGLGTAATVNLPLSSSDISFDSSVTIGGSLYVENSDIETDGTVRCYAVDFNQSDVPVHVYADGALLIEVGESAYMQIGTSNMQINLPILFTGANAAAIAATTRTNLGLGSAATANSENFAATSHSHGNITNSGTIGSTSGLLITTGASGILTTSSGIGSNYITDFNSSVSGLLPVKNITGGSNISVVNTSGNYTVSVSGSLGLTTEEVDDRVAALLVAGSGINLNYNDNANSLTVSVSGLSSTALIGNGSGTVISYNLSENLNIVGSGSTSVSYNDASNTITVSSPSSFRNYELVNTTKSSFVVDGGYSVNNIDVYHNGIKLVNSEDFTASNGTSFTLTSPAVSGDVVEWTGFISVPKINLSLGEVRSDYVGNINYIGVAAAGSSESSSVWRIKQNVINSDGTTIITTTATNVRWTDRLTATYI